MVKENAKKKGTSPCRKREAPSPLRRRYIARLVGRCFVFLACALLWVFNPAPFGILHGWAFFDGFQLFHILWAIWLFDMFAQLFPVHKYVALGSQKIFRQRFRPIREKVNVQALKRYLRSTSRSAYLIFLLWALLIALLGFLYYRGILNKTALFMVSVAFYVCDLICVLIWCPFRLILKNRCCTTCRIFNWDHMMMFTPMLFIKGFFSLSLVCVALLIWIIWELAVLLYPERFWEESNEALQCAHCTDKLCTQYCRKLRL